MTPTPRLAALSLLTLGLLAANPAEAGIWIGNPIVVEALTTDGSTLNSTAGTLTEVKFEYCSRAGAYVEQIDDDVDIAVDGLVVDPPAEEYCSIQLVFEGDLALSGDNNGAWSQDLGDGVFTLSPNSAETAFKLDLVEVSAADVTLVATE